MLFKNAYVFRLSKDFELDGAALAEKIAGRSFTPCTGIRPSSFGWMPPLTADGPLTHEVAGAILLLARREEKVVPASAVNDAMAEKIERLEGIEGRKLSAKERQRVKEETATELIPRALARSKQIMGYITPRDGLLVIDTSSSTEAEMFVDCLRDSLGSFAVTLPRVKVRPTDYFTEWLLNRNLPDSMALGEQCDLLDPDTGATVTCRRQDLATREIRNHIEAGKLCQRIGVRWHGELSVTVDKELALRQLRMEGSDLQEEDDPVAQLDAALADMSMTLARFLPELYSALGGEDLDK